MNPSSCSIELAANQNLAEFIPVSELVFTPANDDPFHSICTTMGGPTNLAPETLSELTHAINPRLSSGDKNLLLDTLLAFPDAFSNSLGHTSVTVHNIDTGNASPIRQYPRRLPYHHRAEVEKQVNCWKAPSLPILEMTFRLFIERK